MRPTAITSINPVGTERADLPSLHDWHCPCGPDLSGSHRHLLPLHQRQPESHCRAVLSQPTVKEIRVLYRRLQQTLQAPPTQVRPPVLVISPNCPKWAIRGVCQHTFNASH